MKILVVFHSVLRELLPQETKGRITLDVPEGSSIEYVYQFLHIPELALCALNDQIESDHQILLRDHDSLRFFPAAAGGSNN